MTEYYDTVYIIVGKGPASGNYASTDWNQGTVNELCNVA